MEGNGSEKGRMPLTSSPLLAFAFSSYLVLVRQIVLVYPATRHSRLRLRAPLRPSPRIRRQRKHQLQTPQLRNRRRGRPLHA